MWKIVCSLLLSGVLLQARAEMRTQGTRFLVVFLEGFPNSNSSKLDLVITTLEKEKVEVRISAPLRLNIGPEMTVHVTRGSTAVANIHAHLNAIGTGICDHGILVESKYDVSVQAYSQSLLDARPYSTAGFRVFPVRSLGFYYMVLTHCEINFCIFAVTSVNDTVLQIDIKLPTTQFFTFNGKAYYNGDILRCTLKAYQILQIKALGDLSGTIVRASEQVAIVVGSDYTTILPWRQTSEGDFLMEQMAPINRWGWTYFLPAFPGRVDKDLVNVLAAEEDVVMTTSSGNQFSIAYRSKVILDLSPNTVGYFTSSGRVIVALYTKSPANKDDDNTDPSMILVPPVEQWSSAGAVALTSPPPASFDTRVILCTYSACNVTLLGENPVSWTEYETGAKVAVITTQSNVIIFQAQNEECPGVSGYIYGQSYSAALAFPVDGFLNIIFKPGTVSSTNSLSVQGSEIVHGVSSTSIEYLFFKQSSSNTYLSSLSAEEEIPQSRASEQTQEGISTTKFMLETSSIPKTLEVSSSTSVPISLHGDPALTTVHLLQPSVSLTFAFVGVSPLPYPSYTVTPDMPTTTIRMFSITLPATEQRFITTHESFETSYNPLSPLDPTNSLSSQSNSHTWQITLSSTDTFSFSNALYSSSLSFISNTLVDPTLTLGSLSVSYEHSSDIGGITSLNPAPAHQSSFSTFRISGQSALPSTHPNPQISPCSSMDCATASIGDATTVFIPTTRSRRSQSFLCGCLCPRRSLTPREHQQLVKSGLTLDTASLSSNVRKRMSIPDERMSAVAIGTGAIIFIVTVFVIITAGDVIYLCAHLIAPRPYRIVT